MIRCGILSLVVLGLAAQVKGISTEDVLDPPALRVAAEPAKKPAAKPTAKPAAKADVKPADEEGWVNSGIPVRKNKNGANIALSDEEAEAIPEGQGQLILRAFNGEWWYRYEVRYDAKEKRISVRASSTDDESPPAPPSPPAPATIPLTAAIEAQRGGVMVQSIIPGRLLTVSAMKSTGVKNLVWQIEPSGPENLDMSVSQNGFTLNIVPLQETPYRITAIVSSPTGEMATATITLPVAEEGAPAVGVAGRAQGGASLYAASRKDYRPLIRSIVSKLRPDDGEARALAGSFRVVAGRIQDPVDGVRSWEEMDRAITASVRNALGPAVAHWADVLQEADAALEAERGSDMSRLYDVLFQIAAGIDGRGK